MSLLDFVAPGIGPIIDIVGKIIDREVPDNNAAQKLKDQIQLEVQQAALKDDLAQLEINKTEASNSSLFVAGARPGFMWLCIFTLGWYWWVAPMATWLIAVFHVSNIIPPMPALAATDAQTALYGLLGLGAYRSADKIFAPVQNQTKGISGVFSK